MKGIAHFAVGVAAASCFPAAVRAGAEGNPLYFVLGGVFGLLPDTIDFRFLRFFHKHDIEVIPDPKRPDPQLVADAVAMAVNRAHDSGEPVAIKLNTVQLGADLWRRYRVTFDVPGRRVVAAVGPVVDTGQQPVDGDTWGAPVSAPTVCPVQIDYQATTDIDIFDGPSFRMEPGPEGRVVPRFIPWHRTWSHSLVTALLCGLAGAVIWDILAGTVIACAAAGHAIVDQLGHMGGALLYPFRRRRSPGLRWMHSGSPLANFTAVWLCALVMFWNLARFTPGLGVVLSPVRLVFYGLLVPAVAYLALRRGLAGTANGRE